MTPLPPGLRIGLDQAVREDPPGTLTGGSPRRTVRLSPVGVRALRGLEVGTGTSTAARALGRRLIDAGMAHPRPAPRDAAGDVTVVVPVRDRPAELDRCLGSLDPGTSVIVLDDGSRESGALVAITARHGARLVRRPQAGGPAAARNTALAALQTEFVAFLDSDCVPDRSWLRVLIGHFEDPLVAAVAPRVSPLADTPGGLVRRYLAARSPLDMGTKEAAVDPGGPVPYVPSAALLVRRSAIGHGFDEDLRYGEDVDLIWRLREQGWRVRYDPGSAVAHEEPTTLHRALARRFRYGTAVAPLVARHPGRLPPVVVRPWPTLVVLLVLSQRPRAAAALAVQQSALLAVRVSGLGLRRTLGARWFGEATLKALLSLTGYVATFGLPLAVAVAWRNRRPAVLGLLAIPALDEWRRRDTDLDPLRWTALALADEAAYGAGVCWGCLRAVTLRPLIPAVTRGLKPSTFTRSAPTTENLR